MLRKIFINNLYAISCLFLTIPFSVNATLIGDNVEAILSSSGSFEINNNFGLGIVGNDIDFQATATDPFGQIWDFSLDIFDNGFTVDFTERTRTIFANISGASDLIRITLNDLDWLGTPEEIVNVTLDNYACLGVGNCTFKVNDSNTAIGWDSDSLYVEFSGLLSDEQYTFAIDTVPVDVPEPSILTLLGLGLVGMCATRRKRLQSYCGKR